MLATIARQCGFPESTHVTWIGLRSRQDWALVRRAVDDGYVLVTHNRVDFMSLMEREALHPGLVCMNVVHGLMNLDVQRASFKHALTHISSIDLTDQVVEVMLTADGVVRLHRYPSKPA